MRDGEQRLAALRAEASEQRAQPAGGPGDEVSKMQKLVSELNQLAAERDALSQELRRSRAPKASSWGGDGPPDLNKRLSIARRSPGNRRVDECEKLQSVGSPRVWICGCHLAGVEFAGTRSIKNGDIEQGLRTRVAGAVHGCPDPSWESHVFYDRCRRRQAEVSRRERALSSLSTLKTRCRRCEAQYGLRGVRDCGHKRSVSLQWIHQVSHIRRYWMLWRLI